MQDKRRSPRKNSQGLDIQIKPLDPQIWFRYWNGKECSLRDLSLSGAGLYCRELITEGTRISVDIFIEKIAVSVRIFAKVVWSNKEDKSYRAGIVFSWWKNEQDKKLVANCLDSLGLSM